MRIQIRARRYVATATVATALAATCGTSGIPNTSRDEGVGGARTQAASAVAVGPEVRSAPTSPERRAATEPGKPRFEDVTRAALGGRAPTPTWGLAFVDHDRDGWTDIFVNRHKRRAWLFRNSDSGLRRMNKSAFEPHDDRNYFDRHACSWGEANGDGSPDLLCTAGAQDGRGSGANQLLIQGEGGFRERTSKFRVGFPRSRGRSINWFDYDRDGDLDLFLGNEIRSGHPNVLLRNARGRFKPVRSAVVQELATVNSTWADWDGDRDPDLLVLAHGSRGAQTFENTRRGFRRVSLAGVTGFRWQSAAWGDYDADGRIDLHVMSATTGRVLRNVGGRFRTVDSRSLANGRMSAWLDVDNDGDLDLYLVQGSLGGKNRRDFMLVRRKGRFDAMYGSSYRGRRQGSGEAVGVADYDRDGRSDLFVTNGFLESEGWVSLLRNRTPGGNWLDIELKGGRWNPLGFGARIRLETRKRVYWRYVTDSFNYHSQSEAAVQHFGLGLARKVKIRVRWANGGCDRASATANTPLTVRKGMSPC